jgi:hypothetical protein
MAEWDAKYITLMLIVGELDGWLHGVWSIGRHA